MNRNSNPRARNPGGNNAYPSNWEEGQRDSMTFRQLNSDEKEALLRDNGCLCGIRIDDSSNPRRSTFPVAQRRSTGPIHARESNEIDTEVIKTKTERETNYVHKGWSLPAILAKSPWTLSRIANTNHVSQDLPSITKRVTTRRLKVELPLEDLKPAPEFESDIIAALEKSNNFEKLQALHQVFERWGDVVPIVFDLGVSLTITDIQSSAERYLNEKSYFGLRQLTTSGTARISTLGGNPTVLESDVQAWLHLPVSTSQWSQVGIIKVVPVTDLLSGRIKAQLSELHKSLITYTPVTLGGVTADGRSFDDTSHALKTISTVTVCCDGSYVKSLSITYRDGTSSDKHGGAGGSSNTFELTPGENITELVVWKDTKWVYAIQMITDIGRASKHYGGDGGTPTILRSTTPGGCLAAFSGVIQADTVHQVQAIWRHDVRCASLSGERQYSKYYGGVSGSAFNDWPLVKHADSSYVSTIRVKCGTYIAGIQVTYATNQNRSIRRQPAPYHGGASGSERTFLLEPDEHIVTILGRRNKYIVQLCFVTNRGRTSDIYGGGDGEDFVCRAPSTSEGKPMRLHYILGKCGDWLNGVQFVWAPL